MNAAEDARNERIAKMRDVDLLKEIVSEKYAFELSDNEFGSFVDMHMAFERGLQKHLSVKQRTWVETAARRLFPLDASQVPRGNPVSTPEVLRKPLPLKPPGRK
jgi:hypothetical protein